MRKNRDGPGAGSPHGVSLSILALECLGLVPFWRIGAGAAFHARQMHFFFGQFLIGQDPSQTRSEPLDNSLAKRLPDAQRSNGDLGTPGG
jgi:hypothetical protein